MIWKLTLLILHCYLHCYLVAEVDIDRCVYAIDHFLVIKSYCGNLTEFLNLVSIASITHDIATVWKKYEILQNRKDRLLIAVTLLMK